MADEGGEKTEEPTDKKIQDTRKKGQVWKSRDFTGVAVFVVGLGVVKATWDRIQSELEKLFSFAFDHLAHSDDLIRSSLNLLVMAVIALMIVTLPVAFGGALVGGLVEFLQVGPLFSHEPLMPKLEKLNPIAGFKNLFSKKQLVELLKNLLKIGITGYVVYGTVRDSVALVVGTVRTDPATTMTVLGELVFRVAVRVTLLLLVFAIFDIWWQRRTYMKDLMMTKDEVKREYKESEGDPHHKAKRKEMHMEILESAQMDAVKGADVVVTNPTHMAVALVYERDKHQAPIIVAKGMNARAEAIKQLAKDSGVAILRNVPLANALYRIDVGEKIPEELYDAVAEVLSFVYSLEHQNAQGTA